MSITRCKYVACLEMDQRLLKAPCAIKAYRKDFSSAMTVDLMVGPLGLVDGFESLV